MAATEYGFSVDRVAASDLIGGRVARPSNNDGRS
jgi:hypothetical protein